jgi:hypothetical protein
MHDTVLLYSILLHHRSWQDLDWLDPMKKMYRVVVVARQQVLLPLCVPALPCRIKLCVNSHVILPPFELAADAF